MCCPSLITGYSYDHALGGKGAGVGLSTVCSAEQWEGGGVIAAGASGEYCAAQDVLKVLHWTLLGTMVANKAQRIATGDRGCFDHAASNRLPSLVELPAKYHTRSLLVVCCALRIAAARYHPQHLHTCCILQCCVTMHTLLLPLR